MTTAAHEQPGLAFRRRRELRLGPVALTLPAFLALVVFFVAPLVASMSLILFFISRRAAAPWGAVRRRTALFADNLHPYRISF